MIVFTIIIVFIDQNNILYVARSQRQLDDLNNKIEFLKKESDRMEQELLLLKTNNVVLEKYAREKFHAKKTNEDVYLIINEDTTSKRN